MFVTEAAIVLRGAFVRLGARLKRLNAEADGLYALPPFRSSRRFVLVQRGRRGPLSLRLVADDSNYYGRGYSARIVYADGSETSVGSLASDMRDFMDDVCTPRLLVRLLRRIEAAEAWIERVHAARLREREILLRAQARHVTEIEARSVTEELRTRTSGS